MSRPVEQQRRALPAATAAARQRADAPSSRFAVGADDGPVWIASRGVLRATHTPGGWLRHGFAPDRLPP